MDIQKEKEAFEAWFESRYGAHFMQFALDLDFYVDKHTQTCWEAWQAKAQAVPEGFVVVPREPYAYLIKHKLWKKDSDPEIFLAVDFLGDDGVEKENLTVCIPLYKGGDEAQEQKG